MKGAERCSKLHPCSRLDEDCRPALRNSVPPTLRGQQGPERCLVWNDLYTLAGKPALQVPRTP